MASLLFSSVYRTAKTFRKRDRRLLGSAVRLSLTKLFQD